MYFSLKTFVIITACLDSLHDTAVKACQQYGKSKAVYIHSANMNPNLPKGSGVQNTIWKCEP
ncbi:hypothetical protein FHK17_21930 [Salmonella enterica]|nr:hypothetical protein [Salmonella enterica]